MKGRLKMGEAATLYAGLVSLVFVFYGLGIFLGRGHLLEAHQMEVPPPGIQNPVENVKPQLDFYEGLSTAVESGVSDPLSDRTVSEVGSELADLPGEVQVPTAAVHTVQVGAFTGRNDMRQMLLRLEAKGYSSRISEASGPDPFFRVWVGAFETLEKARQMENSLRDDGFPTFVRSIPTPP